ncbi:MAG: hypothetical protein HUJ56_10055, partial [Erysipelotrichaceae bacterium]|nr:hypothetical protein [Erysipelotrichaceae bacterium]
FATWNQVNSDIIRGDFGPYLGMVGYGGGPCNLVNIMIPGYEEDNISDYIQIRMNDLNMFSAITDRIAISRITDFIN